MNNFKVIILGFLSGVLTWLDDQSWLAMWLLEANIFTMMLLPCLFLLLTTAAVTQLLSEPLIENALDFTKHYFEKGSLFTLGIALISCICYLATDSAYALSTSFLTIMVAGIFYYFYWCSSLILNNELIRK